MSDFLMNKHNVQEKKCTSKPVETVGKAFYFVDNLRENVLGNIYSLDLNYGSSFGKTEDDRANTSEVEVGRLVQSVRQQSF